MKGFKNVKVSELVPDSIYFVRHSFWGLVQNVTYVGKLGNKYEFTLGSLENQENHFSLTGSKSNLKIFQEAV